MLRSDGQGERLSVRLGELHHRVLRVGGRVEHHQAQLGIVWQELLFQYEVPQDSSNQVPLGAHHGGVLQDDDVAGGLVSAHTECLLSSSKRKNKKKKELKAAKKAKLVAKGEWVEKINWVNDY